MRGGPSPGEKLKWRDALLGRGGVVILTLLVTLEAEFDIHQLSGGGEFDFGFPNVKFCWV